MKVLIASCDKQLTLVAIAAAVFWGSSVHAQDWATHERNAGRLFKAGRFQLAIEEFRRAIELSGDSNTEIRLRTQMFTAFQAAEGEIPVEDVCRLAALCIEQERPAEAQKLQIFLGSLVATQLKVGDTAGRPDAVLSKLAMRTADLQRIVAASALPDRWNAIVVLKQANQLSQLRRFRNADRLLNKIETSIVGKPADMFDLEYWNLRGDVAQSLGRFSEAYVFFNRCTSIIKDLKRQFPDEGSLRMLSLEQLAVDLDFIWQAIQIGDYSRATQLLASAKRFPNAQQPEWLATTLALDEAKIKTRSGDYDAAVELLQETLGGPVSEKYGPHLRNELAMNFLFSGKLTQGAELARQLEPEYAKRFGLESESFGALLVNRAWIAFAMGDFDAAIELSRRAVETFQNAPIERFPRQAEATAYLALMLTKRGLKSDVVEARQLIQQATKSTLSYVHTQLATVLSGRDRAALIASFNRHFEMPLYPSVIDIYLQIAPIIGISEDRQLGVLLTWRHTFQESSSTSRTNMAVAFPQEWQAASRTIAAVANGQHVLTDAEAERLAELDLRIADIERQQAKHTTNKTTTAWSYDTFRNTLPKRSVFMELRRIDAPRQFEQGRSFAAQEIQQYVLFLADSQHVQRIDLGSAQHIEGLIQYFVKSSSDGDEMTKSAREQVRELLVNPVHRFQPEVRIVIASGEQWLTRIPLACLPHPSEQTKYWLHQGVRFARTLRVGADLSRLSVGQAAPTSWLVVGGVKYGAPVQPPFFPPLANTLSEIERVDTVFRRSVKDSARGLRLAGTEASKRKVSENVSDREVVLLSTHAYFREVDEADSFGVYGAVNELDGGICLANANSANADGLLTPGEVRSFDLRKNRVAILSACRTGLGHLQHGGGSLGLVNAFHAAGSEHVVSSFWDVDDEATAQLMAYFAEELAQGLSVANALGAAQLRIADSSVTHHPRYWAAWADWVR